MSARYVQSYTFASGCARTAPLTSAWYGPTLNSWATARPSHVVSRSLFQSYVTSALSRTRVASSGMQVKIGCQIAALTSARALASIRHGSLGATKRSGSLGAIRTSTGAGIGLRWRSS